MGHHLTTVGRFCSDISYKGWSSGSISTTYTMVWVVAFANLIMGVSGDLASTITPRRATEDASSWEVLLKMLSPDLLILDTDSMGTYGTDEDLLFSGGLSFGTPRTLQHCGNALHDNGGNGSGLAEFLRKSLGPVPDDKRILTTCSMTHTVALLEKVWKTKLANWQWNWMIVSNEDRSAIVDQYLANFTEEWQFALVQPYVNQDGAMGPKPPLTQPPNRIDDDIGYLVYSLHPHNDRMKQGIIRKPELSAKVFRSGDFVVVESALFEKFDAAQNREIDDEFFESFRQQSLFPDPFYLYNDFNGRILTTTGVQYHPWFRVWNPECKTDPSIECIPRSGIDLNLLTSISEALNFSLRAVLVADGEWGVQRTDGSFSGMIGDIASRKAEIASCEITISRIRRTAADFSYPYYLETLRFCTTAPVEVSRAFVVLKPFSPLVWSLIALSALLTVYLLKIFQKAENTIKGPAVRIRGTAGPATNWSCTQYSLMIVQHLTGAGEPMPSHEAFRVYLTFWLMYALILAALYSGTLTAYMSVPTMMPTLNSLEDLKLATSSGLLTWGLLRGTAQVSLFKDANSGIYHDLWVNLLKVGEEQSLAKSVSDGVQRVLDSNYAYAHGTLAMQQSMAEKGWSKFHLAREGFFPNFYGVAIQKGSPFKPVFDRRILQLLSGGFLMKWSTDAVKDEIARGQLASRQTEGKEGESSEALQLDHLQGAFIILTLGYGCSILAWVGEWVLYKQVIILCWRRMTK